MTGFILVLPVSAQEGSWRLSGLFEVFRGLSV